MADEFRYKVEKKEFELTGFASRTKAMIPATKGVADEVPPN
jgi:hypothetical protein